MTNNSVLIPSEVFWFDIGQERRKFIRQLIAATKRFNTLLKHHRSERRNFHAWRKPIGTLCPILHFIPISPFTRVGERMRIGFDFHNQRIVNRAFKHFATDPLTKQIAAKHTERIFELNSTFN